MNKAPMGEEETLAAAKDVEVPASEMKPGHPSKEQMTPEPLPEVHQRTACNDGFDLYLVKKELLGVHANPDLVVAFGGKLLLERFPKRVIKLGPLWERKDGDECPEHPTHVYVIARRLP